MSTQIIRVIQLSIRKTIFKSEVIFIHSNFCFVVVFNRAGWGGKMLN